MTPASLKERLRELCREEIPLPGSGSTPARLRRLVAVGLEDLSLAKLAEAHWDALAILVEAGRRPEPNAIYAVWASEVPGQGLSLVEDGHNLLLSGRKPFCSGLGIVDRALVTVSQPRLTMLDVDLREQASKIEVDLSQWKTTAFSATNTGAICFRGFIASRDDVVGPDDFYLKRPGFWHGACGPAACWIGGAAGLVEFARQSKRADSHTLAHLGAMDAVLWGMEAALYSAGVEIDTLGAGNAMVRALRLRHIVEQGSTDILHRLPRAYGPFPLALDGAVSRRYHELDLYLRQTHGERDLEVIGRTYTSKDGG